MPGLETPPRTPFRPASVLFAIFLVGTIAFLVARFAGRVETDPIVVPSPSGATVIQKQYGPSDQADFVDVSLKKRKGLFRPSIPIVSSQNLDGVVDDDGITVGWTGEHRVTIGWPQGANPVGGPARIGEVDIDYRSYVLDITSQQTVAARRLTLHDVSLRFNEAEGQNGGARYATGEPVPLVDCIVAISGIDGQVFDQVTIQVVGHGIGHADDPYPSFGGVGIKIGVTLLPSGKSPALTLTQAQVAGIFPRNDIKVAPRQAASALSYRGFTVTEAEQIFTAIKKGSLNAALALTFGQQVLVYHLDLPTTKAAIEGFDTCSAKTHVYGRPFYISPE